MEAGAIYAKLAAITAETEAVGKDRKNTQQGYNFRGIDDLVTAIRKSMAKHGVTCVPRVTAQERFEYQTKNGGTMHCAIVTMEHAFYADDGSSVIATTVGEGSDSGDKASNKAMSAALKYALLPIFLLAGGEDSENDHPERATRSERAPYRARETRPEPPPAASQPATSGEQQKRVAGRTITEPMAKRLWAIANEAGKLASLSSDQVKAEVRAIVERAGFTSTTEITSEKYDEVVKTIDKTLRGMGDPEGAFN